MRESGRDRRILTGLRTLLVRLRRYRNNVIEKGKKMDPYDYGA